MPVCDLDGDDRDDLVVASWDADGTVWALRGRDGEELWRFSSRSGDLWTAPIRAVDLDGDRRPELIVLSAKGLHALRMFPR